MAHLEMKPREGVLADCMDDEVGRGIDINPRRAGTVQLSRDLNSKGWKRRAVTNRQECYNDNDDEGCELCRKPMCGEKESGSVQKAR